MPFSPAMDPQLNEIIMSGWAAGAHTDVHVDQVHFEWAKQAPSSSAASLRCALLARALPLGEVKSAWSLLGLSLLGVCC